MRIESITPRQVELAPNPLEVGVLYISQKYRVAVHLCCCGCGEKVVTPLSEAEWQLQFEAGEVTLHPSVGNSTPCRSHYWIRRNRVVWARNMTNTQIRAVHKRDREALDAMHVRRGHYERETSWIKRAEAMLSRVVGWFQGRR